ncbi:unnamed protein product [Chondrus crispus]|uniref:Uncharacterized protein n=1 Tax=Chondrus crispus TaxID=2769 RepID=R7QTH6_CHOCR|nr:unnamed protein product [Chondrus crispus]CDF40816.1 unnamed protein product [Chondrus crispus]|eukprot:XP_005711110.1 unnamed protein product [Chondrus crispus]
MIVSTAAFAHGGKVARTPAQHSVFEGREAAYQAGQFGMPLSFPKESPQNFWRKADFLVRSKRK